MKAYFLHPDQLIRASLPMTVVDWQSFQKCEPRNLVVDIEIEFNHFAELHLNNFHNNDTPIPDIVFLRKTETLHAYICESEIFALAIHLDHGPGDTFLLVAWTATSGVLWTQHAHGTFTVRDGVIEEDSGWDDPSAIIFGGVSSISNEMIWNALQD